MSVSHGRPTRAEALPVLLTDTAARLARYLAQKVLPQYLFVESGNDQSHSDWHLGWFPFSLLQITLQ